MSIYQHFRKHEHQFVDQVLSWKEQVERTYTSYITDFLDPRERKIIESLIGSSNEDVQYAFFGGADHTERQRAIIAPFYETIEEDHFKLVLLEASFPKKFVTIQHRDILGTFISEGLDRKKIGDIFVRDDAFQIVTTEELASFIMLNIDKIKNASVQLKEVPRNTIFPSDDEWMEQTSTVSSLRLDVLIKEMYNMSRKDASLLIQGERVKVNFTVVNDPAFLVEVDDLLSVRGHGRGKIISIDGVTRKEKVRITTAKLKM